MANGNIVLLNTKNYTFSSKSCTLINIGLGNMLAITIVEEILRRRSKRKSFPDPHQSKICQQFYRYNAENLK